MVDRRSLLLAATSAALAGCGKASPSGRGEDPNGGIDRETERRGDIEIVQGLLALEHQSAGLYAKETGRLFRRLEAHERDHAARLEQALARRGAKPRDAGWMVSGNGLGLARKVEETAIAAYLDAMPKVVDDALRGVLASIVAVEAGHLAEVRRALGLVAANQSFVTGRRSL